MQESLIAKRYANALLEQTENKAELNVYEKTLKTLASALENKGDILSMLFLNPSFSLTEQTEILEKIGAQLKAPKLFMNFLYLLAKKGRLQYLGEIYRSFENALDFKLKRLRATVKTAKNIESKTLLELTKFLEHSMKKPVVTKHMVDADLIAGINIEVGSMTFDKTVKKQLAAMQRFLINEGRAV